MPADFKQTARYYIPKQITLRKNYMNKGKRIYQEFELQVNCQELVALNMAVLWVAETHSEDYGSMFL
jgi:hypothetical protein